MASLTAIPAGVEGDEIEASYRPVVSGDPAVREFHAGEEVRYESAVVGMSQPVAGELATATVYFEGKLVSSFTCPIQNSGIAGNYTIPSSAQAGQYALKLSLPSHGKEQPDAQCVDFTVTN